jgi:regulation of enolase protein 1 (concanavalin A-like superfamily)
MHYFFIPVVFLLFSACKQQQENPQKIESKPLVESNIDQEMVASMQWINIPNSYELTDGKLQITVGKETDYFNNPEDGSVVGTAPLLYREIAGDFVVKALVRPDFSSKWNAVSLMVYQDSLHWIKFAFENSDATGPGIVSVVTKDRSDDANGAVLNDREAIWLAIARKENNYAMHWSKDGQIYNMARLTQMPATDTIKVGIEAQSPVGDSATHQLLFFDLTPKTVKNLRDLNDED